MTDETLLQRENSEYWSRRGFLRAATGAAVAAGVSAVAAAQQTKPNAADDVQLSQIHAATEQPEKIPGPFESRDQRTGFAIVGLGRLALGQILPAMAKSKYCKPVALVSGDRAKAQKIAAQYGIPAGSIYDYTTYDQLAKNPAVQVIYIVLPNSMHAEYTIRGAKAGKHILCEKPMATTAHDCQRMIDACNAAGVKLMIAYRSQYEANDVALVKMIRAGRFGKLRQIVATNSQNQGDPSQWRLKKALAGGGCMPDVGVYCLNAARFLSNEEPYEVQASVVQPKDDPRFTEVESSCQFIARFPSGLVALCNSGYDAHKSQFLRVEGVEGWAEMHPAFAYTGIKLQYSKLVEGEEILHAPAIEEKDQFAAEMDHMALCVQQNLRPHTPGEEGLQDQIVTDAIYESAKTGRAVKIPAPKAPTRGPEPSAG
ncbi:Tat (twin-arginine translocation) pathway signal sequence [Granulicella rosea]|uniref:Tat (Twin-arginine translocation) pathway signal sequence n=1 Tax=Granulicella rosea TaxID=474952 RepID=A0A239LS68_9BACT|nr:Gfo/Idh/MocA family oxidoreductase [Granulicella rosea]SNT32653.1 Tat (twin-arginine translocation) pathway signal sequence [Granulicella rosea]